MKKENFAKYLEEVAAELRAFDLTINYLDDFYASLVENAKTFYNTAYDNACLKSVK